MNALMSNALLVARGLSAAAEAGVRSLAEAMLPGARTSNGESSQAVADMQRQVADLRQRVLQLEGRLAAGQARRRSDDQNGAVPTSAATSPAAPTSKRTTKKAPAAKKATPSRSTGKRATKRVPSPKETSGVPDTPATVAERASVTKPAD